MRNIKLVIADADGTLISNGSIESTPLALKKVIRNIRDAGILFSIISGRDEPFLRELYRNLVSPSEPKQQEALMYEDACIRLFSGEVYCLGGIDSSVLDQINKMYDKRRDLFAGLVSLPNNKFTIRASWVTEEFASGKPSNVQTLDERYESIKELTEEGFPMVEVVRSADAIDVISRGVNKALSLTKYLGLLKGQIAPPEVLAIGDAVNDEKMLRLISEAGGKIGFVGTDKDLEARISVMKNGYISNQKGPFGTCEVIEHFCHS